MKMMLGFPHLRETGQHLTHEAWNSMCDDGINLRLRSPIRRRRVAEPNSTSQDPAQPPAIGRDTRWTGHLRILELELTE